MRSCLVECACDRTRPAITARMAGQRRVRFRVFFANDEFNGNGWRLTWQSIRECIHTAIGGHGVLLLDCDWKGCAHVHPDEHSPNHCEDDIPRQARNSVARVVDYELDEATRTAWLIMETDNAEFIKMLESGDVRHVSPGVCPIDEDAVPMGPYGVLLTEHKWRFLHVAFVDVPAYGPIARVHDVGMPSVSAHARHASTARVAALSGDAAGALRDILTWPPARRRREASQAVMALVAGWQDQDRHPPGSPEGGRWKAMGGGITDALEPGGAVEHVRGWTVGHLTVRDLSVARADVMREKGGLISDAIAETVSRMGFGVRGVKIVEDPHEESKTAAGMFDPRTNTIHVNVGLLTSYFIRHGFDDEDIRRYAASVVRHEVAHAIWNTYTEAARRAFAAEVHENVRKWESGERPHIGPMHVYHIDHMQRWVRSDEPAARERNRRRPAKEGHKGRNIEDVADDLIANETHSMILEAVGSPDHWFYSGSNKAMFDRTGKPADALQRSEWRHNRSQWLEVYRRHFGDVGLEAAFKATTVTAALTAAHTDQPRHPKGTREGGRWRATGQGSTASRGTPGRPARVPGTAIRGLRNMLRGFAGRAGLSFADMSREVGSELEAGSRGGSYNPVTTRSHDLFATTADAARFWREMSLADPAVSGDEPVYVVGITNHVGAHGSRRLHSAYRRAQGISPNALLGWWVDESGRPYTDIAVAVTGRGRAERLGRNFVQDAILEVRRDGTVEEIDTRTARSRALTASQAVMALIAREYVRHPKGAPDSKGGQFAPHKGSDLVEEVRRLMKSQGRRPLPYDMLNNLSDKHLRMMVRNLGGDAPEPESEPEPGAIPSGGQASPRDEVEAIAGRFPPVPKGWKLVWGEVKDAFGQASGIDKVITLNEDYMKKHDLTGQAVAYVYGEELAHSIWEADYGLDQWEAWMKEIRGMGHFTPDHKRYQDALEKDGADFFTAVYMVKEAFGKSVAILATDPDWFFSADNPLMEGEDDEDELSDMRYAWEAHVGALRRVFGDDLVDRFSRARGRTAALTAARKFDEDKVNRHPAGAPGSQGGRFAPKGAGGAGGTGDALYEDSDGAIARADSGPWRVAPKLDKKAFREALTVFELDDDEADLGLDAMYEDYARLYDGLSSALERMDFRLPGVEISLSMEDRKDWKEGSAVFSPGWLPGTGGIWLGAVQAAIHARGHDDSDDERAEALLMSERDVMVQLKHEMAHALWNAYPMAKTDEFREALEEEFGDLAEMPALNPYHQKYVTEYEFSSGDEDRLSMLLKETDSAFMEARGMNPEWYWSPDNHGFAYNDEEEIAAYRQAYERVERVHRLVFGDYGVAENLDRIKTAALVAAHTDQPRHPKGTREGGRWRATGQGSTPAGGGGAGVPDASDGAGVPAAAVPPGWKLENDTFEVFGWGDFTGGVEFYSMRDGHAGVLVPTWDGFAEEVFAHYQNVGDADMGRIRSMFEATKRAYFEVIEALPDLPASDITLYSDADVFGRELGSFSVSSKEVKLSTLGMAVAVGANDEEPWASMTADDVYRYAKVNARHEFAHAIWDGQDEGKRRKFSEAVASVLKARALGFLSPYHEEVWRDYDREPPGGRKDFLLERLGTETHSMLMERQGADPEWYYSRRNLSLSVWDARRIEDSRASLPDWERMATEAFGTKTAEAFRRTAARMAGHPGQPRQPKGIPQGGQYMAMGGATSVLEDPRLRSVSIEEMKKSPGDGSLNADGRYDTIVDIANESLGRIGGIGAGHVGVVRFVVGGGVKPSEVGADEAAQMTLAVYVHDKDVILLRPETLVISARNYAATRDDINYGKALEITVRTTIAHEGAHAAWRKHDMAAKRRFTAQCRKIGPVNAYTQDILLRTLRGEKHYTWENYANELHSAIHEVTVQGDAQYYRSELHRLREAEKSLPEGAFLAPGTDADSMERQWRGNLKKVRRAYARQFGRTGTLGTMAKASLSPTATEAVLELIAA